MSPRAARAGFLLGTCFRDVVTVHITQQRVTLLLEPPQPKNTFFIHCLQFSKVIHNELKTLCVKFCVFSTSSEKFSVEKDRCARPLGQPRSDVEAPIPAETRPLMESPLS